jgi:hypothetical protein
VPLVLSGPVASPGAVISGTNTGFGLGVSGTSGSDYGVRGSSTSGDGVHGYSNSAYGVSGTSTNSIGVRGDSTYGYGVYGFSSINFGVFGDSDSLSGVYGRSNSANGVDGSSHSANGVSGGSITGHGVTGGSISGHGVSGHSENGTAGYFSRPSGSGGIVTLYSGSINTHALYSSNGDNARMVMRDENGNIDIAFRTDRESYFNAGYVGIGTTSPAFLLHVNGSAGKPGGGSWSNASDARLKKNIRPLEHPLDELLQLRGVTFEYKEPEKINELPGEQIGMVAQQVEEVFPQWVDQRADGFKAVTYRGFEALTVEAFRQLREEKDTEIAELRDRLSKLETVLAGLAGSTQSHSSKVRR